MKYGLSFEWDLTKAVWNFEKHGISFEEASSIFKDFLSITIHGAAHSSIEEERYITLGLSTRNRLIVVVHCERDDRIRIISARQANRLEKRKYEEGHPTQRN